MRTIGRRIRYTEHQDTIDRWRRGSPHEFHPPRGATGTIVGVPEPGTYGASVRVRWDTGQTTWLGSLSRFEYI